MTKEECMGEALEQARLAALEGEVPVGAVVVKNGTIIARGRNQRETGKNALYHAEIMAIDHACKTLGGWRLWECELYVTLEPCPMCAGAIINSRIQKVVFGAKDEKAGCAGTVVNLFAMPFNHRPAIEGGFLEQECTRLLQEFFQSLRQRKKGQKQQQTPAGEALLPTKEE